MGKRYRKSCSARITLTHLCCGCVLYELLLLLLVYSPPVFISLVIRGQLLHEELKPCFYEDGCPYTITQHDKIVMEKREAAIRPQTILVTSLCLPFFKTDFTMSCSRIAYYSGSYNKIILPPLFFQSTRFFL